MAQSLTWHPLLQGGPRTVVYSPLILEGTNGNFASWNWPWTLWCGEWCPLGGEEASKKNHPEWSHHLKADNQDSWEIRMINKSFSSIFSLQAETQKLIWINERKHDAHSTSALRQAPLASWSRRCGVQKAHSNQQQPQGLLQRGSLSWVPTKKNRRNSKLDSPQALEALFPNDIMLQLVGLFPERTPFTGNYETKWWRSYVLRYQSLNWSNFTTYRPGSKDRGSCFNHSWTIVTKSPVWRARLPYRAIHLLNDPKHWSMSSCEWPVRRCCKQAPRTRP